ncbi:dihydrodipicolinate synthase family protein [Verminephrobacter eiseniae]|uniref:dihydrodipicolinate synthase family protein n=1 Tax=Verminephrobacter eiseniae TaxID=364317 RepID=UPI0022375E39|nr:dihydrodipicolinate synthase family protein [Verminephrobacter eiseniae]MCW5232289.1 dihydrodipicolinate synthase family protein [Verminephrobacter eiseniae]MCW5296148.1 dihydrodipicolinate synthase family protein [Verminephrobacter eiseniae]MCW8185453.1 dihydrodipicolinate synthase family protein [Verminephrobacter eiseniae]MCW8224072.1 dihydrodipicolinate synthase family protein [Verminephrobacter eiseniae]MCW8235250.1 dihydrodipicolinate synthase family protein [Verminephrobacter eisenia
MPTLQLPTSSGASEAYALRGTSWPASRPSAPFNRVVFSAAHVVVDPLADADPSSGGVIDWDATLAYRRYLAELGLGIAEAMDTAQRGMGLGWADSLTLIRRTREALAGTDVPVFNGCGTDHLDLAEVNSLDDVVAAYQAQVDAIQSAGGRLILMASRALARVARTPDDYVGVYRRVLAGAQQPVILHWLGDMFDSALKGYWGTNDLDLARDAVLQVIEDNRDKVDGIKISLLDKDSEIDMRRRLPASVKMYTGDDFNYPELIAGDAQGHSHVLLGIFDAIAPAASHALGALAAGDSARFHEILAPTVPLSRRIFGAPTRFYKTGVVFLAYLNGHQSHMVMLAGHQAMRPLPYFVDVFKLADQAGLLRDPDLAAARMRQFLAVYGVGQ